ncbi:MAG: hypothetical protein Q9213_002247 [Squamulea squamosa]
MAEIDVEAAALHQSPAIDAGSGEATEMYGHDSRYILIPTSAEDGNRHDERMYRLAQVVTERLLRSLKLLVHQELQNSESVFELLEPSSAQGHTAADAGAITYETGSKLGVGSGGRGGDMIWNKLSTRNQLSDDQLQAEVEAADAQPRNGHGERKLRQDNTQQPSLTIKPVPEYALRVVVMTKEEVEADNERRRSIRGKWGAGQNLGFLEDHWKNLWRRDGDDAEPLFRRCTNEERQGLQLDLIDALFSVPNAHKFELELILRRGLRAISCWVSLIGLRLSKLCGELPYKYNDQTSGIYQCPASRQIQVLIECIRVCNTSSSSSLGDVLISCYRRGVLQQPTFKGGPNCIHASFRLRIQFRQVRVAIYLMHILYKHKVPMLAESEDLSEAWSATIAVAELAMRHKRKQLVMDMGSEPFLTVSDLNLKDLQELGRLRIEWTSYWDEHLELETKRSINVLKLYWFSPRLSEIFSATGLCGELEEDDRMQGMEEISLTLNLLLTSKGDDEDSRKRYDQLEAPSWLQLLAHERLGTWDPESDLDTTCGSHKRLSNFWNEDGTDMTSFCYEMKDHWRLPWPTSRDLRRITFAQYPIYYQRLRDLRCFMDAQQPRGLRALWRDNRNSDAYYTFWIAFTLGVLSVLIAFLALVAAVVQAWSQVTSSR